MKFLLLSFLVATAFAGNKSNIRSLNRFWLMNDRMDTDDLMRPYKRDYVRINIDAAMSKGFDDFNKDVETALESATPADFNAFVQKHENTEHFLKADVGFGVWLPGWNMWNTDVLPSIRAEASVGALITNRTADASFGADFCAENNIPAEYCQGSTITVGSLFMEAYAVGTGKGGLNLDFKYDEKWTVDTFIYGMTRYDAVQAFNAADAATGTADEIELKPELTETVTANADLHIGFNDGTTRIFAGVSELKLSTIKDHVDNKQDEPSKEYRALFMGSGSPVYRVHIERRFDDLFLFDLIPFAGAHYREQYEAGDGVYGGLKFVFGWKAFHFAALGMYDPEYVTLTPRLQLGIIDIEGTLKSAHKEKDDFGVKLADIYAINFRFHF